MLWLKTLGAVMVLTGSGSYGLISARKLGKRVEQLKSIRLAIGFLEKEITYMHTPLSLAMSNAARSATEPVRSLFSNCSQSLQDRQGIDIHDAWMNSLSKLNRNSELAEEDIQLLTSLSLQMGMSGAEEQKKLFAMIQEQLKILEGKARAEMESGYKIRTYGGFILGAAIVLLLL